MLIRHQFSVPQVSFGFFAFCFYFFLYNKDKILSPVFCKTPLISNLDPMIVLDNCLDVGEYQFMAVKTIRWVKDIGQPTKYYMRDKQTDKIFIQKIILHDYKGKELFIYPQCLYYSEKVYHFTFDLFELKQAYKENRLSGQLKELVANLNENEDNEVFMFAHFK